MKVLVGCEFSATVRTAFLAFGHDAISCDLLPSELPGPHIQDDLLKHLNEGWDLGIFFPPCTYLAVSGAMWFTKPGRSELQQKALDFVKALMNAPINRIAIENPVGVISTRIRKPDQIIHPWQFGHEVEKTTCLWLKNLPELVPTRIVPKGPMFEWKRKNGTPTRPELAGRISRRSLWSVRCRNPQERSRTFPGIAIAMAEQWGNL